MQKLIFIFAILFVLSGCSGRPEEKIVGTWEFQRMDNLNGQQLDPLTQQMLNQMIGQMTLVFTENATCTTTTAMSISPETGKYWLENGGKVLVSKPDLSGVETRSNIMKLTNDELILTSDGESALVFRKK